MARLVMKFGGTSVADLDRIRNVARHVKREVDAGHDVAVVVSAMAGTTNQLVAWCREAAMLHDAREYDAVVASGEQVTAGLLAEKGYDASLGARPLRRTIQRLVEDPLAEKLLYKEFRAGETVVVDVVEGEIVFEHETAMLPPDIPPVELAGSTE